MIEFNDYINEAKLKLNDKEEDVLLLWGGTKYTKLAKLEKSKKFDNPKLKLFYQVLDKLPKYKGNAFRGISKIPLKVAEDYAKQKTITFGVTSSASTSKKLASNFIRIDPNKEEYGILFIIKCKTAANYFKCEYAQPTLKKEKEVILRRESKYKVTKVKIVPFKTHPMGFGGKRTTKSSKTAKIYEIEMTEV